MEARNILMGNMNFNYNDKTVPKDTYIEEIIVESTKNEEYKNEKADLFYDDSEWNKEYI